MDLNSIDDVRSAVDRLRRATRNADVLLLCDVAESYMARLARLGPLDHKVAARDYMREYMRRRRAAQRAAKATRTDSERSQNEW